MEHLLLLWCVGAVDLASMRRVDCTQEIAFKVVDGGPAPEKDGCAKALGRWLDNGGSAIVHNANVLRFACEVPR